MADYTIKNLEEIEDMAPKFGFAPDMEARFGRKPLGLEGAGASFLRVASGFRVPFGHTHSRQEEVYFVIEGGGRIKLDDDVQELREGDFVRIPPGVWRNVEGGSEGLALVAFGAPGADNSDVEMAQGWWSD
jgi:mannose-6-phosphate isomerase-like protein (cupin superfamily)